MQKKMFVALNIITVIIIIITVAYIIDIGRNYSMHTRVFFSDYNKPDVSVTYENDNVVEMVESHFVDNELVLELKSINPGRTKLIYSYDVDGNTIRHMEDITVANSGLIIDRNRLNFQGYRGAIHGFLMIITVSILAMIWIFFSFRKHAGFSYQMVACGGFGIFLMVILLFISYKGLNNVINSYGNFLGLLSEVGYELLLALTPVMFIMSVFLAISNVWLIRNEGFRFVNLLGFVFGILWMIGTIATLGAGEITINDGKEYVLYNIPYYSAFRHILVYVIGYFECMFISTALCAFYASKYKPTYDKDYIIILGCAIRKDGTVTPLLKGRVDSAINFEKEQYNTTGRHATFVPSGGQGSDEVIAEAEAMKNYMISQGVSAEQILVENKSANTFENMDYSGKLIKSSTDDFNNKHIGFATTNYHVFRGYILAKKNGFNAQGISSKTKLYFFPNAFLREFIGLLDDMKYRHIAYILFTVFFFSTIGRI